MASFVQKVASSNFGSPINVTVSAVGSGNAVVVVFKVSNGNQPVVSVTDNASGSPNTYAQDYTVQDQPNDGDWYAYRCNSVTGGPTQVSITLTSGGGVVYGVYEISGLASSSTLNQTVTASGTSTTPAVSFTTDSANEVGIAWADFAAGVTLTPDSPWTEDAPGADPVFDTLFSVADLGAAGSKSAGGSYTGSTNWRISAVSYRTTSTGNNYTVTTDDATTAADESIRYLTARRAADEFATISDDPNVIRETIFQFDEETPSVDQSISGALKGRTITESSSVMDDVIRWAIKNRFLDESLTATDLLSASLLRIRMTDEPAPVIDDIARTVRAVRLIDETLATLDELSVSINGAGANYVVVTSDGITVIDDTARIIGYSRLSDDTAAMADSILSGVLRTRAIDEFMTPTDDAIRYLRATRDLLETLAALDDLSAAITSYTPFTSSPRIRVGIQRSFIEIGGYQI